MIEAVLSKIPSLFSVYGEVQSVSGLSAKVSFNINTLRIGSLCEIEVEAITEERLCGEVIGFSKNHADIMVFGDLNKVKPGAKVFFNDREFAIYPDLSWKGHVLDAFARPFDDTAFLSQGQKAMPIHASPPSAFKRAPVGERLDTGVRAINTFLTLCKGQRIGIFAGSGVGKSMLLSMLIKYSVCDVVVVGLIGERGRELHEFLDKAIGRANLKKCITVVATSDQSALMRKQAAYTTMTIAEYFRDKGLSVLCVMDSVTRFAMAQREIGLSCGEIPATKGYTPSVFAELPKLLERAGPGEQSEKTGYITGIFTVLVDGDDHNEPISDAVRGILDGHIVLDRSIAERNHYPAINVLKSISRTVPGCHFGTERAVISKARQVLSTYNDMADMIRIGAYKKGSNTEVDEAISLISKMNTFTAQNFDESESLPQSFHKLSQIVGVEL